MALYDGRNDGEARIPRAMCSTRQTTCGGTTSNRARSAGATAAMMVGLVQALELLAIQRLLAAGAVDRTAAGTAGISALGTFAITVGLAGGAALVQGHVCGNINRRVFLLRRSALGVVARTRRKALPELLCCARSIVLVWIRTRRRHLS